MTRRLLIGLGVLALIAGVSLAIFYSRQARRERYDYSGTVETREIQVGSKVAGRVTQVGVEEGQAVQAGALLVRFEDNDLKAQRAEAVASVNEARATLKKMQRGNRPEEIAQAEQNAAQQRAAFEEAKNGPRKQEIAQAQADYEAANADAIDAQKTFERMQMLVATDTISRQEFDDYRDKRDSAAQKAESARQHLAVLQEGTRREDVQSAEARYAQAQSAADLERKGFREEDIDVARGQLASAEAHVADLDVSLREEELTAPANGLVEVVSVRPGDLVPAGRIVVTMLEASQLWVKVYVPETDLAHVQVGQAASITVDGMSSRTFKGHVGEIAAEAEFLPRNVQTPDDRQHQVFGIKVYVDDAQGALKSGMSATVHLQ